MKLTIAIIGFLLLSVAMADDQSRTFEEICENYGYPLEKYEVTTSDGYILQTFRIPHGLGQTYESSRTPVIFQHGAFDSSDALFMHGPEWSPAFYLANQGYDVWVTNRRGTKYGRNHTSLSPDDDVKEFWDFSFIDSIPDDKANIQLVLQKTGHSKLAFVAQAESFATLLTALTTDEQQWFKDRISFITAISPISKLDGLKSPLLRFLGKTEIPLNIVKFLGYNEWFGDTWSSRFKFRFVCNYIPAVCERSLRQNTDGDPSVNDRDVLRVYMGHFPGGLSVKILDHDLQLFRAGKFQYFDYGEEKNTELYGTATPPEIPVDQISGIPMAMMVGTSDLLGSVEDNEWLRDQLGDNIVSFKTYDYGRASFYIAKDMHYLEDLADLLQQFA